MDRAHCTIDRDAQPVRVAEFRRRTDALCQTSTDYHACVSWQERANWLFRARKAGRAVLAADCRRATDRDWLRRERAIERSSDLIAKVVAELHRIIATGSLEDLEAARDALVWGGR